jgi:hypothetical protein
MPTPVIDHYFDENFVQQVRHRFLETLPQNQKYYDKSDVHKLLTSDWFVRRFLAWRPTTVETAVKSVHEAMKWRNNIGINDWYDFEKYYIIFGINSYRLCNFYL